MSKLSIFVIVLLTGLGGGCQRSDSPERFVNVPPTAIWAGGPDGGAWIECRNAPDQDANFCTTYNDSTGEVWKSGYFVLRSNGKAAAQEDLVFEGFDGERIFLKGGKVLDPVDAKE